MLAFLPALFAVAWWAVTTIAISYGLAYLGGVLFGTDVPEADVGSTADAQSRSWNPHSTQQEGIARPRAWGKSMHHGNIVAKWTDVDANKREILYMIVEHGDGPTKGVTVVDGVKQIFLNDQPITNFTSVETQERIGTMNQTCMNGFGKHKDEYPQNVELKQNEPVIFTTHNDYFDDLEYTILWPNGLYKRHKDGDRCASYLRLKVRIRVHGTGDTWTEIFNEGIYAEIVEPYFRLWKVSERGFNCVRGTQYDLEFTNLTGKHSRTINDVYIKSVREVINVAFTRPGKALIGIKAIATERLSGKLDVKVVREDRIIWTWNGSVETIQYSRNRAWVVWDALTQPVISGDGSGEHPWIIEYYEGMNPSRLDLTFFLDWADFCSTQKPSGFPSPDHLEDRIACDTILDFQTDVWTFVNEIANIGRAYLYWQGHTLTGWIDKVVTEEIALVTMDNIMARTWKNAWTDKGELAGKVEIFFNDSRQGYERTHAPLPNESAGKYTRIISLEGIGITTRGTAIHVANHVLKRNELIRNVNNFRQYKEAFRYKLGQVIRIQHKTPDWGESYRVIKSTADNKVTLDRICTAVATDLIFVQGYDGAKVCVDSYTIASVAGKVVTIEGIWDITPLKDYMVAIGVDGDIKQRRIIKIDSTTNNYFDITVETYDPVLFTADDMTPDNPDQHYIWPTPANPLTRPVTRWEVVKLINQMMPPAPDIEIPWPSNIAWCGNSVDTIYWNPRTGSGENEPMLFRYRGTTYEIADGVFETTEEFVYWDPDLPTRFRTTDIALVALAPGNWLMCRNKNGVAYPANAVQLMHGAIIQAGTITAAYGQIDDLAVDTLQIAGEAVTKGVSAYTEESTGLGDVQDVEITTTGLPVTIIATVRWHGCAVLWEGICFSEYTLKVIRDTTEIYTTGSVLVMDQPNMVTICLRDTPPEGTYTYKLNLIGTISTLSKRFLFVQEVKR